MSETTAVPAVTVGELAESSHRRALIVEDDDAIRALAAHLLRRDGFAVTQTANGREAVDFLNAGNDIDVIVLDLALPVLSGVEVVEYIRAHLPFLLNRIVIVTANVRAFHAKLPDGICQILVKPFDIHQFLEAVRACMRSPAIS